MDFSFLDRWQETTPPKAIDAQDKERVILTELAQNIPCLEWNYNGVDVPDTGTKLGLITQSLKRVPSLASMVSTDERGVESYDAALVAGAALAAVSALARVVLNVPLSENYAEEPGESGGEESVMEENQNENLG